MRWRTGLSSIIGREMFGERPTILAGRPPAQGVPLAPAAWQHAAVLHVHAGVARVQRLDRRDLVQVDDVAAVDAGEARRIELRLDRRRSEEHTSELQSRENLVCRLL